jgi:nitrite reductase/ring-hydroxylating ferredoxin subunit
MFDKKMTWHRIAAHPNELSFAANQIAVVEADGKKLCIARFKDTYYSFAYKCPHASGIMADGFIDALGQVVCPLHRYRFNMQNGRNVSGEGYFLKTYPVEHREDGLFVGL